MAELEPCPFCGRQADICDEGPECAPERFWAYCSNPGCFVEGTGCFATEEEAAQTWNARWERTCEVVSVRYDPVYGSVYTLSCCDDEVIHDGEGDPPKHCQHCGAKVVER